MRLRRQLIGVALLGLALSLSLMSWKAIELVQQSRVEELQKSTLQLNRLLAQQISRRVDDRAHRLASVVATERRRIGESGVSKAFLQEDLLAVALLQEEKGGWKVDWTRLRPGVTSKWPAGFIESKLAELPLARAQGEEVLWTRVTEPSGQPMFAYFAAVQEAGESTLAGAQIAMGLVSAASLAGWLQPLKGLEAETIVIEDQGNALSFQEQQYVGASLTPHPLVAEIIKARETESSLETQNLKGQRMIATYSRVPHSNLFVATLRQPPALDTLIWHMLIYLIGFLIVGIVVIAGLTKSFIDPFAKAFSYLHDSLADLAQGRDVHPPTPGAAWLTHFRELIPKLQTRMVGLSSLNGDSQGGGDRLANVREVGMGISQALKGPLAAILGHAQLARSKSDSEELKDHYVVIEREARRSREILENLIRILGHQETEKKTVEVRDAILAAIAETRSEVYNAGIRLQKDVGVSALVHGQTAQLQSVVEELIRNAIEALRETEVKEIKISLAEQQGRAVLTVEDSGEGIAPENLSKVFDPFFTTHSNQEHAGLGLALAKGTIRSSGGDIRVESKPGAGTRFIIELPIAGIAKQVRNLDEVEHAGMVPAGSAVAPLTMPKPERAYETPSVSELGGKFALSGTVAEDLPSSPGADEVTLVGESEALKSMNAGQIVPEPEDSPVVATLPDELILDLQSDELTPSVESQLRPDVTIRSPKVRSQK